MVVVISRLHVWREVPFEFLKDLLEGPGDVEGAPVGLAADVEQHGIPALSRDHVEDRFRPALDAGEILDANRVHVHHGDGEVLDILDTVNTAIHNRQVKRVVLLMHAGRRDKIVLLQGVGDLRQAQVSRLQAHRINDDVIFGRSSPH